MSEALYAEQLCFAYNGPPILNNVSFKVSEGEFIGLIGPNGGGKTTLLKLILGFLKPSSGQLSVFGAAPAALQKDIAYVPQNMRYDRHFPISVYELVLSGRLAHLPWYGIFAKSDHEKALSALKTVGLSDFAHRAFGTLSGGQQQRILIARALASEPALLLLDEPTANVDHDAEQKILELLQELKGKITILMVTHDLQTAIDQVDRVLCVQQGVISYSPQEVCEHYALGLYHPPLLNLGKRL